MRILPVLLVFLLFASCEEISDITRVKGPCTIQLASGGTISTANIEILESTRTLTYRDEEEKLWSLSEAEYSTYSCGN